MAAKLLWSSRGSKGSLRPDVGVSPHGSMNKEFQIPYDGAWWVERGGHLVADRVEHNGPADKAGIRQGDQLATVNGREVKNTPTLERQLYTIGVWSRGNFSGVRHTGRGG